MIRIDMLIYVIIIITYYSNNVKIELIFCKICEDQMINLGTVDILNIYWAIKYCPVYYW